MNNDENFQWPNFLEKSFEKILFLEMFFLFSEIQNVFFFIFDFNFQRNYIFANIIFKLLNSLELIKSLD